MKLTRRDFALFGVIIYFTFIGGTFYSQLNFFVRVFNQMLVTGLLGVWLVTKLRHAEGLPRTYLDLGLALYLLVNVIAAVLGQSPRYSLETMWYSVVHLLAFYVLVDLMRRGWTTRLAWAFYMTSAVVCLVGLAEFIAWYTGTPLFAKFSQGWLAIGGWQQPLPPLIYRLSITLNGPTALSAYLALLIPPALGLIVTLPRRNENRKALMVWLVLAFIVQFLTFSRAGMLALGVSLPLSFIGWLKATGKGPAELRSSWSRLRLFYRLSITLVAAIILMLGLFWLQRGLSRGLSSTHFRFTLWEAALTIFTDDVLTGAGPANFGRALLRLNDSAYPRLQFSTAHNIYLNTAAELGLPGLAVGGYLLTLVGLAWRARWRQTTDATGRTRLAVCGAALAGLAAQTLVDTYLATPNMLLMLALVATIVSDLQPVPRPAPRPVTAWASAAILLLYAVGFGRLAAADYYFESSLRREASGRLSEAVARANQAQALDPALTLRTFRLALLEARRAGQTADPILIQTAIDHYRAGLAQEPMLGLNSANLAGLLWQQGQRAEAIELLERTILAEEAPLYLINLGYFYEQEGDWVQAGAAYGHALFLSPALAASGFWQAESDRARRWSDFVEAAVDHGLSQTGVTQQTVRLRLALAQEDFEAAAALIESTSTAEPFRDSLAEIYLNMGKPEQAEALLAASPQTARDYFLWGWLRLEQGDDVAAETLLKTAVFMGDQNATYQLGRLYEQRGDIEAAERAYQNGFTPHAISENIAVTIYGRFGGNDLAPQLVRMGVGPPQAKPWLALARLYEQQHRSEPARQVYSLLLAEDPWLQIAQDRLALLDAKQSP
jgi:tetratricopeptide (TPR) repeat protein